MLHNFQVEVEKKSCISLKFKLNKKSCLSLKLKLKKKLHKFEVEVEKKQLKFEVLSCTYRLILLMTKLEWFL